MLSVDLKEVFFPLAAGTAMETTRGGYSIQAALLQRISGVNRSFWPAVEGLLVASLPSVGMLGVTKVCSDTLRLTLIVMNGTEFQIHVGAGAFRAPPP